MRDSSRDCHACCRVTGYPIAETPRCPHCELVLCDDCIRPHQLEAHGDDMPAPYREPQPPAPPVVWSDEQLRECIRRFGMLPPGVRQRSAA